MQTLKSVLDKTKEWITVPNTFAECAPKGSIESIDNVLKAHIDPTQSVQIFCMIDGCNKELNVSFMKDSLMWKIETRDIDEDGYTDEHFKVHSYIPSE